MNSRKYTSSIPNMSDVAHYPYRITKDMLVKAMNELDMRNKK